MEPYNVSFFFTLKLELKKGTLYCVPLYDFYIYIKDNPSQRGYFYFTEEQTRAQRGGVS